MVIDTSDPPPSSCSENVLGVNANPLKCCEELKLSCHYMAHRLELAIKIAVDAVKTVSHFRCFVDELYKVYSTSPKTSLNWHPLPIHYQLNLRKFKKSLTFVGYLTFFFRGS